MQILEVQRVAAVTFVVMAHHTLILVRFQRFGNAAELAQFMKADPETVRKTLNEYNDYVISNDPGKVSNAKFQLRFEKARVLLLK